MSFLFPFFLITITVPEKILDFFRCCSLVKGENAAFDFSQLIPEKTPSK